MQLLYVYIGGREALESQEFSKYSDTPYKVFKDVEFNFSNELIFSYEKSTGRLLLKKNPHYIPNFFDKSGKIKNVTGIIGQNGTGKSTILDYIIKFRSDNFKDLYHKTIFIFYRHSPIDDPDHHSNFVIYHHKDILVTPQTKVPLYSEIFNKTTPISLAEQRFIFEEFSPYKIVYYSPAFEVKGTNIKEAQDIHGDNNLQDISTIKLLRKDADDQRNSETPLTLNEALRRHKALETERQIRFLNEYKNARKYLGFTPPDIVEVKIDHIDEHEFFSADQETLKTLQAKFGEHEKILKFDGKEHFMFFSHRAAFFNTVRYLTQNSIPFKDLYKIIDEELNPGVEPPLIRKCIKRLSSDFRKEPRGGIITGENEISNRLDKLVESLIALQQLDKTKFNVFRGDTTYLFLSRKDIEDLKILNMYFQSVSLNGFLLCDWRFDQHASGEMSSGEKALISLFSRFYYAYLQEIKYDKTHPSVLFLIDEGDQHFHPEWQRKYFDSLRLFLSNLYTKAREIQIILTTHSPFIASDLPPFSIIKLVKNGRLSKVLKPITGASTFAANIHELFTDSFYLKNGLIGEFAKNKILELSRIFKEKKVLTEEEIISYIKQIDLIQEVIIREKLWVLLQLHSAPKSRSITIIEKRLNIIRQIYLKQ